MFHLLMEEKSIICFISFKVGWMINLVCFFALIVFKLLKNFNYKIPCEEKNIQ